MGKFENFIICSDFDGTFHSHNNAAAEKNINAIEYFKQNGGLFTFATGRDLFSFINACSNAGKIANTYAVVANGARLYDFKTKRFIADIPLKLHKFLPLMRRLSEVCPFAGIRLSFEDCFVLPYHNELIRIEFGDRSYEKHIKIIPFDELEKSQPAIYKCVIVYEAAELDKIKQFLEMLDTASDFKFSKSYPTGLEVIDSSTDKGKMLIKLKQTVNPAAKTFAIGDYLNDIEMLNAADCAAAPENALPEVKAVAALRTGHCDQGALADLINQIENMRIQP